MITEDDYLHEGYDRMKDDESTETEDQDCCEMCGKIFSMEDLDIIDNKLYCRRCEEINEEIENE